MSRVASSRNAVESEMDSSTKLKMDRYAAKIVSLQSENIKLNDENQLLAQKFNNLTEYNQTLGDDLANFDEEIVFLEQQIYQKTTEFQQLSKKADHLDKQIKSCRKTLLDDEDFSQATNKLKKLEEKKIAVMKKLSDLKGDSVNDGDPGILETRALLLEEVKLLEKTNSDLMEEKALLKILIDNDKTVEQKKAMLDEMNKKKDREQNRLLEEIQKLRQNTPLETAKMLQMSILNEESQTNTEYADDEENEPDVNKGINEKDEKDENNEKDEKDEKDESKQSESNDDKNSHQKNDDANESKDKNSKRRHRRSSSVNTRKQKDEQGNEENSKTDKNKKQKSQNKNSENDEIKQKDGKKSENSDDENDRKSGQSHKKHHRSSKNNKDNEMISDAEKDSTNSKNNKKSNKRSNSETRKSKSNENANDDTGNDDNKTLPEEQIAPLNMQKVEIIRKKDNNYYSYSSDYYSSDEYEYSSHRRNRRSGKNRAKRNRKAKTQQKETSEKIPKDTSNSTEIKDPLLAHLSSQKVMQSDNQPIPLSKLNTADSFASAQPSGMENISAFASVRRKSKKTGLELVDIEVQTNEGEINPIFKVLTNNVSEREKEALSKLDSIKKEIESKLIEKKKLQERLNKPKPKFSLSEKLSVSVAPLPDAIHDLALVIFSHHSRGIQTDVSGETIDFHKQLLQNQVSEMTVASDLQDEIQELQKQITAVNESISQAKQEGESRDQQIKKVKEDLKKAKQNIENEQQNQDLETRMKKEILNDISNLKIEIREKQGELESQTEKNQQMQSKLEELIKIRQSLERDIEDMSMREKPEIQTLSSQVQTYSGRVKEAEIKLKKAEDELEEKREILLNLKKSDEMKMYKDLLIRKVKLERRLNKWKILLKDSRETMQSLEAFSRQNFQRRQLLAQQLEKYEREKADKEEELRDLEGYSSLLNALLHEQNENWS